MKLWYNEPTDEYSVVRVLQTGSIVAGQNYAFCKLCLFFIHSLTDRLNS